MECAGYWLACRARQAIALACGDALPVARLAAICSGELMVAGGSGVRQFGVARILDILAVAPFQRCAPIKRFLHRRVSLVKGTGERVDACRQFEPFDLGL